MAATLADLRQKEGTASPRLQNHYYRESCAGSGDKAKVIAVSRTRPIIVRGGSYPARMAMDFKVERNDKA
jgi:hypothetical protein